MALEELPEELMALILLKVPVKSLLRCKCIKKSWHSLIKSPQFIHLHRSSSSPSSTSSRNYNCFIARRSIQQQPRLQHVLSLYSYETLDHLGNEINIPFSLISDDYTGDVMLSGSCDGLVCLTNRKDQILICNPATREFRSLFVPPSLGNRSPCYHIDSVAFGSDPNTGEYKVVIIGVPYDNNSRDEGDYGGGDREAQVYDFSTDSWRETGVVIPAPFRYSRRAVLLNGAFHWSNSYASNVLAFHMSNEMTELIPLPDFVYDYLNIELFVSSKSQLSIILYDWGDEEWDDLEGRFEICVMTAYGVKESWTRLIQIGPLLYLWPLQFWGEQQLLLTTVEGQLVSCDLQNRNLRHFPIYGVFDVYPFSESLVSVNRIGK